MSKTVHPYAHRLSIIRDWKSRWFSLDSKYKEYLRGDVLIRQFLLKKLRGSFVSLVEIERNQKHMKIIIKTSRPGMIIGRSGEGSTKLKQDIVSFMKKNKLVIPAELKLDIIEIQSPDSDASIVGQMVAESLERRMPYRRVLKQMVEKVMAVRGVKGAAILLGGRLGGAEIARSEQIRRGSIPLQTFRADIDFVRERAHLPYGDIGIKVWIYKGEVFAENANRLDQNENKS